MKNKNEKKVILKNKLSNKSKNKSLSQTENQNATLPVSTASNSKSPDDFIYVGKVQKTHGLRGEFLVHVPSREKSWLSSLKVIQLKNPKTQEIKEYFLKSYKHHNLGFIVCLEEFQKIEEAELLKNFEVFIPSELLKSEAGDCIYLNEILHFSVQDITGNKIGKIVGFQSTPAQDLIVLCTNEGKELAIPLVEAYIVKKDFDKKELWMDLPEGLLEY